MDIHSKLISEPNQSMYLKQSNVRRKSQRGGNMRYENVLLAADQDAD